MLTASKGMYVTLSKVTSNPKITINCIDRSIQFVTPSRRLISTALIHPHKKDPANKVSHKIHGVCVTRERQWQSMMRMRSNCQINRINFQNEMCFRDALKKMLMERKKSPQRPIQYVWLGKGCVKCESMAGDRTARSIWNVFQRYIKEAIAG